MFVKFLKKVPKSEVDGECGFSSRVDNHSFTDIFSIIYECISVHADALSSIEVTDKKAFDELYQLVEPVMNWVTMCMPQADDSVSSSSSSSHSVYRNKENHMIRHNTVPITSGSRASSNQCAAVSIVEVLGTEETLSCASLGLKGQIDMVVQAYIGREDSSVMPVELKTGKWTPQGVISHRAQVHCFLPAC